VSKRSILFPSADGAPGGERIMLALIALALLACLTGAYALVSKPARRPSPAPPALPSLDRPRTSDIIELERRHLELPVSGVGRSQLVPSFDHQRGDHPHEAIDIIAPRGTPVVAVEDATIAKLFTSKAGGLTIYLFDPSERYAYYYAHLDRYADGLKEGERIGRGQIVGYVGSTGNANPAHPHLHFSIFRLGPERRWWEGVAIDPYPIFMSDEPR
jgi:murein DD-endopeptidase MepM/ murein hydrolase activator NlpD